MRSLLLLPFILLTALPAEGRESQRGYSNQCFKTVYREEYVPGTQHSRGYVKAWEDKVEVPCQHRREPQPYPMPHIEEDTNSCIEGSIMGGLLGGGLGGALSTQENWIWSIPTGIVGGAMVGCQMDGG